MVCASEGDNPNDINQTPLRTMARRFFSNPKAQQFQPSKKVKDIIEESKIDPSDFSPKLLWDPKNPPKKIWDQFSNVIRNEDYVDYMDDEGSIVATNLGDYVVGSSENDTIEGRHGSDLIYGGDGDDHIYGDQLSYRASGGVDTIYGGNGNDVIWGNVVYGERGVDRLHSPHPGTRNQPVAGYLNGGKGDDYLYGNRNNDTLIGGDGDDWLEGMRGGDIMDGGRGADKFIVGHQRNLGDLGGDPGQRDLIVDFQDPGDHIEIPAITYRGLEKEDVDLEFNSGGALVITVNDPSEGVSGVVAEVHGLDANQPIDDQINWIYSSTFELV